ncbi:hypothetical protein RUM44_004171 [Polyplax serrata]|uniref:Uncharacterized protein n=1 Tax=Polyplax serrata TaxID=468196 RepID=A0ABR1B229_POLSC
MPKKNKKSKSKKCDQNSSRKDESFSLTPDETVAKEGFCLPLDKKLKMQIKRHKKKGEIQISDTSNAEPVPEVENVEKKEVVSVSIAANNDAISTALEPKVAVSSPEVNETEETRENGNVEEPVDDVTKIEDREQKTSEPKASEANYRIEIIPEDLFEEFIEKEEVTQVRETVKAFPRISPIHSPNAKRKHLEKEALVTSCPPPKVLYNYQGISFNDTYIQAHLNEDERFQDERKEQDNSHNWKLHVIQEESSDLSDTSAHSEPKEKSRIRTVIIDNRGIPEEVEFQSTGVRSEGREPCKLYSLQEEISEDLESSFSSINNSSAACEIKSHFLNECDDNKTDFGEKGSIIGSDQSEALTRSVEGSQSGLDHSNENIQNGENKKTIKMRTDLSEKSTWSIKSISSTSYQPDEESESWRSSLEPEIYNGSEADIESELDSLAVCILDNYDDKLGISMNDIVPVDYSDGIKLFITNYKYKNILNKPENVGDSTADLQTSAFPVEVPCKATLTQQAVSDTSRTNESVIGNDCTTSCNKNGVPVIADGYIKKQTISSNGDVKNKIEALKDDVEKILISKIKVMKSFNDPTLNETSWGSIVESTKNEMKLRNARTNDWNCSSEKWHTSNASSYENVSRLETMVPVARYVFQTKETQNPDALSNLAEKKILTLPYGKLVLKKIGLGKCCSNDSDSSKDFAEDMYMKNTTHENEQSFGLSSEFSDVSTQSVPLSIWNRIKASEGRELSESRSYIEFDYADRRIGQTEKWYGAPTVVPAILLGLSPSQKKVYEENPNRFMADKAEAASLLDLHKKFLERRSYNESNSNGTHKGHEFDTRTRRDFVTLSKIDGPDRISGKMTQSQPENKNLYTLDKVKESSIAKKNMKSTNTVGQEPESPKRRLVGNEKSKPVDSSGSLQYNKTCKTEAAHSTSFAKGKGEKHGESEETVGKSCLLAILQNAISDNSVPELNKDCSTKPNSESHEVSCVHNHGTMLNSWQNNPIFGYTNKSEESLGDELFGEDHTQSFEKIWNKEKNITTGETKKDGKSRPRTICCGTESELLVSEPLIEKKYAHHKTFPSERSNADTNEKYIITEKLATVSDTIRSFEQTTIQSGTTSCRSLPNVSRPQIQNSGGYQISRQGDVFFHQKTGSDEGRKVRNENRKSMPAFLLSEREKFKQKMYDEYMSKLAERVERRQKKVIRVSQSNEFEFPDETKILDIENEFIKKVKERREKFGRPQTDIDEELESLKKTCQEFTDYWKEETTNLESGKIVFGETKNKNEKDGETDTSSSKRSSFQLISDRSSDFDSLPKHLKELLEVDKEEFPDFLGGEFASVVFVACFSVCQLPNQLVYCSSAECCGCSRRRLTLKW